MTVLLLSYIGAVAQSKQDVPPTLVRAVHCLAVKDFLPQSNTGKLTFGYLLDEKSYPGDKVLYIVAFATPTQTDGSVFTLFQTGKEGHEIFIVQNNAGFVLSKQESLGVSFVTPPLGGDWTQEHLAAAIKAIEKQPRFTISIGNLPEATSGNCESYTDPQPSRPNAQ